MELDARTYRGKVYKIMLYFFRKYRNKGVVLRIFNEGSSRSGKTFDTFDFLVHIKSMSTAPHCKTARKRHWETSRRNYNAAGYMIPTACIARRYSPNTT